MKVKHVCRGIVPLHSFTLLAGKKVQNTKPKIAFQQVKTKLKNDINTLANNLKRALNKFHSMPEITHEEKCNFGSDVLERFNSNCMALMLQDELLRQQKNRQPGQHKNKKLRLLKKIQDYLPAITLSACFYCLGTQHSKLVQVASKVKVLFKK